jgi:hypothetical protein
MGAQAVAKGRDVWRATPDVTPARLAQAWMSWALPSRCETVAKQLQAKATLMGASFKVNDEPAPAAAPPTEAPADAKPADDAAAVLTKGPGDAPATPPADAAAPPAPPPAEEPSPHLD